MYVEQILNLVGLFFSLIIEFVPHWVDIFICFELIGKSSTLFFSLEKTANHPCLRKWHTCTSSYRYIWIESLEFNDDIDKCDIKPAFFLLFELFNSLSWAANIQTDRCWNWRCPVFLLLCDLCLETHTICRSNGDPRNSRARKKPSAIKISKLSRHCFEAKRTNRWNMNQINMQLVIRLLASSTYISRPLESHDDTLRLYPPLRCVVWPS